MRSRTIKEINFEKMAGAGNDFIVMDDRSGRIDGKGLALLARRLCDRKTGVGADGLILLLKSEKADYRMRIINSDGTEAEMCGNGVRCLAQFAINNKIAGAAQKIETLAGVVHCQRKGDEVCAQLTDPKDLRINFDLKIGSKKIKANFINTGVPHTVIEVDAIEDINVDEIGRKVRWHPHFKPKGTNVNFVKILNKHFLKIRTYERGVEGETLACGTGSTAAALIGSVLKGMVSPVDVHTQSGETLKIYYQKKSGNFCRVLLEGRIKKIFEGRVRL